MHARDTNEQFQIAGTLILIWGQLKLQKIIALTISVTIMYHFTEWLCEKFGYWRFQ